MDYEKKVNSKLYRFFDFLYKLLIMNLLTFFLSLFVFTLFPAVVALNATIKNDIDEPNPFKSYFSNFKKYFKKSLFIGILLLVLIAVVGFAFFFYSYNQPNVEENAKKTMEVIFQMGIVVMVLLGIVILMVIVHIPLLMVTFESLTCGELIKTAFYVSFRYFLTTLILVGMFAIKVVGILAFPIWILFGISLPTFLGIRFTKPVYYKFEKIDLEKIMHEAEEDINE
ncbi:MAG: DUF624 domain-containing protein [Bacilli bacterium]|nr:DUF624 domain-containing protein [Bacilli bacterium]MDY4052116.1 DUF624 domain-containing protein [Bacilli bacterium]